MSVQAHALTTLARLKSFLGITVTTYDAVLELIIDSCTDFIESHCDRRFKKTVYTDTKLDGEGTNEIVLPQWPVLSKASTVLYEKASGAGYGSENWAVIVANKYRIDLGAGIINAGFKFPEGSENHKVDFTAGFNFENSQATLIPLNEVGLADLELTIWKLCGRVFTKRKGGGDVKAMKLYNYAVTYEKEAFSDDEIKEVLDKYKRFSF